MITSHDETSVGPEFLEPKKLSLNPFCKMTGRRKSSEILRNVDSNFHHILKMLSTKSDCGEANEGSGELTISLLATMKLQGACIAKVIRDEMAFLDSNRISFPDDLVGQNLSTYQFWEQCFLRFGVKPASVGNASLVRSALESFMLFMEFYRSVENVLTTWPIPIGCSFPRTTDRLDVFLDRIPVAPGIAYSLAYRPRLPADEIRNVVLAEYRKAEDYLSSHLRHVEDAMTVVDLNVKTEIDSYAVLEDKVRRRRLKIFEPVEAKLNWFRLKIDLIERHDCRGMDWQAERVYASQQLIDTEGLVRSLNLHLQRKMTKYLTDFYLGVKKRISCVRGTVRSLLQQKTNSEAEEMKRLLLSMLSRWDDSLDDVIDLNQCGVLEVIINVHDMETEVKAFLQSVENILI